jgi:hypothetical protein
MAFQDLFLAFAGPSWPDYGWNQALGLFKSWGGLDRLRQLMSDSKLNAIEKKSRGIIVLLLE